MISVIIILKNDPAVLGTINHVLSQSLNEQFEIIVVDRSTISYNKIPKNSRLKWVRFDPRGKQFTIPEQRNVGIASAKGDIIVFLDASCLPAHSWLQEIIAPIRNGSENIVMGRTGSIGGKTLNDLSYDKLKDKKYVLEAPTINMAIKRNVFKRVGNFDENLAYGSDVDFSWRAIDKGMQIRYWPKAYVEHDWGNSAQEIKRTLLYGRARVRLIIKHLDTRWKNLLTSDSPVLLYPFLILLLPFSLFFPILLLFPLLLVLKNFHDPNPFGIVVKHYVYGWGVLTELFSYKIK